MLFEYPLLPLLFKNPFLRAISGDHLAEAMLPVFKEAPDVLIVATGTDQSAIVALFPVVDPGAQVALASPVEVLAIAMPVPVFPRPVVEVLVVVVGAAETRTPIGYPETMVLILLELLALRSGHFNLSAVEDTIALPDI